MLKLEVDIAKLQRRIEWDGWTRRVWLPLAGGYSVVQEQPMTRQAHAILMEQKGKKK